MSDIQVLARSQTIKVDPATRSVSVIQGGPMGPAGPVGPPGPPGSGIAQEVVHDWLTDGWTPFTELLINPDVGSTPADQTLSVVNDRGRVTNTHTSGSKRVAYIRDDTEWLDSEVCSLWWGGNVFDSTGTNPALPQCGHFHRGYTDIDGYWRAIVVTNNIFLSDNNVVNANVWNIDPTEAPIDQLDLGALGTSKTYNERQLQRGLRISGVKRISFGSSINEYFVTPSNLHGIDTATPVVITTELDATFANATAAVLSGANLGSVQQVDPETGPALAAKFENGTIVPTTASGRRYWPYWVKSRLTGSVLRVKVWRLYDAEPDWGSDHVFTANFGAGQANDPSPARYPNLPGFCGLLGNHLRNGRYLEYGHFSAKEII